MVWRASSLVAAVEPAASDGDDGETQIKQVDHVVFEIHHCKLNHPLWWVFKVTDLLPHLLLIGTS